MPREVSAPSNFHKPVKSVIGGSFTHFQPGGHWDKPGTTMTGKLIGPKKQAEWQEGINSRSQVLLSSKCSIFL